MFRQVSSRSQRSKGGFKVKHVIQVCTLVGVSVWLLYQINHSHYKKKVYQENEALSSEFSRKDQLDITRLGQKDLPRDDAKTVEQTMQDEGINRDSGDLKLDGLVKEESNGEAKGQTNELEEQEREENSHEAREKTFTGDDASSEVVHNSLAQEGDHDERSHEAQEKSFKADDASSAVDHATTELKQSEPESEGIRDLNEKPSDDDAEKKDKENEIDEDDAVEDPEGNDSTVMEMVDTSNSSVSPSGILVNGSDSSVEHQPDHNTTDTFKNLDSQIEESKDQIDLKTNSSSVHNLTTVFDSRTNVTAENQFKTSSVLQDQTNGYNNSEKIEDKEKPDTAAHDKDQELDVINQEKQEISGSIMEKPEESSQVSSEEERREDDVVSSLPYIQDKVKIDEEQAGEYDQEV